MEFHHCAFQSCSISNTHVPSLRTLVRRLRLVDSSEYGCFLHSAICEDIVIDGLKTHGDTLHAWGAVFKHVVLKGKIGNIMTSNIIFAGHATSGEQQAFNEANAEYYRHVDWALDISQGDFTDIDIRGVPGRLVRRDPETQVLITRQAAWHQEWDKLEFRAPLTAGTIQTFLQQEYEDMIFVAPKRDRGFRDYVLDIQRLRAEGIAERD